MMLAALLLLCPSTVLAASAVDDGRLSPALRSSVDCGDAQREEWRRLRPLQTDLAAARVVLTTHSDPVGLLPSLSALGATVEVIQGEQVQARIPWSALPAAAALEGVRQVREPHLPSAKVRPIRSEWLSDLGATAWHEAGATGQGVRIAVLDVGFAGYRDLRGGEQDVPQLVLQGRAVGAARFDEHICNPL